MPTFAALVAAAELLLLAFELLKCTTAICDVLVAVLVAAVGLWFIIIVAAAAEGAKVALFIVTESGDQYPLTLFLHIDFNCNYIPLPVALAGV